MNMIPVFEPDLGEEEIEEVVKALRAGEISGSFGRYIPDFENAFSEFVGCKYGVAVTSGTTALHLAVAVLELNPGDEVIISTSTNIATALAVYHNGGIIIPIDSEMDSWNMDVSLVESHINEKTKAIIPVHLFGHPVKMDSLTDLAKKYSLTVIEDCAESHGATYKGQKTGSFGHSACFSFYANKIITTGEGGMLTTNDQSLAEKYKYLRNLAFGKPRFFHKKAGFNFRMTGYQAAMGLAQTRKIETIIKEKRRVAHIYNKQLESLSDYIQLPIEQKDSYNVYWMYGIVLKDKTKISKNQMMESLNNLGVESRSFFCPIGQQPFIKEKQGNRLPETPIADRLWERGLYLPSSPKLSEVQIKFIANTIEKILKEK
jgi:perosamine synthetase